MKKGAAIFFLLLANIIILAHAVLPHHHHEQLVCIEHTNCSEDVANNTHNSTEHNHQHDGTDSTTCVLKQAVIIPNSQGKLLKSCDNCSDNHNNDFYILKKYEYKDLPPIPVIVTTVPKFLSFLTSFVSTTLGLRAPPIV